jgi:molybdate transport system substrate-binding protein
MPRRRLASLLLAFAASGSAAFAASAATDGGIKVLSAGAVEPGLVKLAEQYRRDTGHEVKIQFGTAPQLAKRLDSGESADILIAPPAVLDEQIKAGKVDAASGTPVGRVGVGVTVRSNAPSPAVSSLETLKQTLLAADSVVYNQASTGLYLEKLFERMGIAEQLKAKTTRYANGAQVLEHVIKGKGREIGFGAMTEIRMYEPKGLKLVGPLPGEVQNYTSYSAGVMTTAASPERARDFIRYLTSGTSRAAFAATGVE